MRLPDLTPTLPWITQTLHISLAANIVLVSILAGYRPGTGFLGVLIFASVKDGIWDLLFEVTTWREELLDFCFYISGGALTALLCWWLHG